MTLEVAEAAARLPSGKWREVLEYARWMRDNGVSPAFHEAQHDTPRVPAECGLDPSATGAHRAGELKKVMRGLGCIQRRRVDDYIRALASDPPRGVPGHAFLRFVGTISPSSLDEIERAVRENCERIDAETW